MNDPDLGMETSLTWIKCIRKQQKSCYTGQSEGLFSIDDRWTLAGGDVHIFCKLGENSQTDASHLATAKMQFCFEWQAFTVYTISSVKIILLCNSIISDYVIFVCFTVLSSCCTIKLQW